MQNESVEFVKIFRVPIAPFNPEKPWPCKFVGWYRIGNCIFDVEDTSGIGVISKMCAIAKDNNVQNG